MIYWSEQINCFLLKLGENISSDGFLLHFQSNLPTCTHTSRHPASFSIYVQQFLHYDYAIPKYRHLSVAMRKTHEQWTCSTEVTIGVDLRSKVIGCSSRRGFKCLVRGRTNDILKFPHHPISIKVLYNADITSPKESQDFAICNPNSCTGPSSQSTKQFSH